MKKLVTVVIFLTLVLQSCNEESVEFLPSQKEGNVGAKALKNSSGNSSCGELISGQHTGNGYYAYPDRILDFSCIPNGSTVSITFEAVEVPNKFRIVDANNNTSHETNWLGNNYQYSGPWGQNLLYGPHRQTIIFQKVTDTYTLKVETITQGNRLNDEWNATVNCSESCDPPCPDVDSDGDGVLDCNDDCPNVAGLPELNGCPPPCNSSCGDLVQDTYTGSGYYMYSDKILDFSCIAIGTTISLVVEAVEVPNRFRILDGNGNNVHYTNWLGETTDYGPWTWINGGLQYGPHTKTITFLKTTNTYKLRVETITQGREDEWNVRVNCGN